MNHCTRKASRALAMTMESEWLQLPATTTAPIAIVEVQHGIATRLTGSLENRGDDGTVHASDFGTHRFMIIEMTYRAWSPMESGTVSDAVCIDSSRKLQDDSSPMAAVGRRWPVRPLLMTAEAVNGGGHRKAAAAVAASLS